MFKKIFFAGIALTLSLVTAQATPIQFSFWGTGTGTVGQSSFDAAEFTIDAYADTDNISGNSLSMDSASFTIAGLGAGDFTEALRMFTNGFGTGLSSNIHADLIDFVNTPALKVYDLASSTLVYSETSPCCASQFSGVSTTLGNLNFSSYQTVFFQATLDPRDVPEPAPLALLGLGLLGLGLARKCRS